MPRTRITALSASLLAIASLVACGDDSDDNDASDSTSAGAPSSTASSPTSSADTASGATIEVAETSLGEVLTSGGMPSVEAGFDNLVALHRQAAGRITLLAGGGLKLEHIPQLRAHGLREFHLSGRSSYDSPMLHRRPDIPMGGSGIPGEYVRRVADPAILREVLSALD